MLAAKLFFPQHAAQGLVFVIPGGAQIGCTAFDRTGTTRLGSFVFNHSYMRPGLAFVVVGTAAGWFISQIML